MDKFTIEDIENCWRYALEYFLEVLNGEYDLDVARKDLRSLINTKYDLRVNNKKESENV